MELKVSNYVADEPFVGASVGYFAFLGVLAGRSLTVSIDLSRHFMWLLQPVVFCMSSSFTSHSQCPVPESMLLLFECFHVLNKIPEGRLCTVFATSYWPSKC